jgi:predicted transcriptional regulator
VDEPDRTLLLALRPQFAHAILNGNKTVELRRQRPAITPEAPVLLYAASPTKALVGSARLAALHVDSLDNIWTLHGASTGITRAEYDNYYQGTNTAVALTLTAIKPLTEPIPLTQLRIRYSLEPPQSYRFLDAHRSRQLLQPSQHPQASTATLPALNIARAHPPSYVPPTYWPDIPMERAATETHMHSWHRAP